MANLAEEIKRMIEEILQNTDWTSASPNFTNKVKQINATALPDLEEFIREGKEEEDVKRSQAIDTAVERVDTFDKGNIGEVHRFTREQFGNVRSLAHNPIQFLITGVFGKFAKGAGVAALALVFFEVVKFIIDELLKPGRFLDRRFRRDISKEILAFRSREEKQKLLQGRANIIVTSIGGLRGGAGQVSSNLRALAGLQSSPIPNNFQQPTTTGQASGQDLSMSRGKRGRFGQ